MTTPTQVLETHAAAGHVFIKCDPGTARDIAEALATAYATCAELEAERPAWFVDVAQLHASAAKADVQNGHTPDVALVPLYRTAPTDPVAAPEGEAGATTTGTDRRAGATDDPRSCPPRPRLALVQQEVASS